MNLHFNWHGCFFQCHSLGSLAVGFMWLCSWKTQPGPIYTDLSEGRRLLPNIWQYATSSILSATRCSGLVLFAEKHLSTSKLHTWDGVLRTVLILLLLPNMASGIYAKKFYFGPIWPQELLPCLPWFIEMVPGRLHTGLDMCWCDKGNLTWAAGL